MAITSTVKDMNIVTIRKYMRQHFESSKSEIARDTKMSVPTVSRIIDLLCSSGELFAKGEDKMTGGRSASIFSLNIDFSLCLLIKIEGKGINWTVKNLKGQIICSGEEAIQSGFLEFLDSLIIELEKEYTHLKIVVIGISAMVANDTIEQTIGFSELKGINMSRHFQNLTDIPVHIENDMNIVGMGQWFRSKKKAAITVGIYMGDDGFGASIVKDGEVWHGATNFAGELVYLPFYEGSANSLKENYQGIDMIEFYAILIQIYAVLLNPDQIVLYANEYLFDYIGEVRKKCNTRLPSKDIPQIELSSEYQEDYEDGLYATAQKILDEA